MAFGLKYRLLALLAVSLLPSCPGETVLENQPALTNIVRFETAWMPEVGAVWRKMPRADGEFILAAIQGLKEWDPKSEGGCILPPLDEFCVRAVAKNGGRYYIRFTTRARFVWSGYHLLDIPHSKSTEVIQRVERVLSGKVGVTNHP